MDHIKSLIINMHSDSHWHYISLLCLFDELHEACATVVTEALTNTELRTTDSAMENVRDAWRQRNDLGLVAYSDLMKIWLTFDKMDSSMVFLVISHLKKLVK